MKKIITSITAAMLACFALDAQTTIVTNAEGQSRLCINGQLTYVQGVCGTFRLSDAAAIGANGSRASAKPEVLAEAKRLGMHVQAGINFTKDPTKYIDEEYKADRRKECRELAEKFKDDETIFAWALGNEIDLNGEDTPEAWMFINELAEMIKSIDRNHLVTAVICQGKTLNKIAKYAPALDYVGINKYGSVSKVQAEVEASDWKKPYMITEWGPTGWWECAKTEWGAPIEETAEEKRAVYEKRYNEYILNAPRCMGSFVFLWGQKEERTPTWFGMFTERNVEGLPHGLKTPTIEAMERVWTGKEPEQTAPVIHSIKANGLEALQSPVFKKNQTIKVTVDVDDRQGDPLFYVWEVLAEATVTATGGAYEPRPERLGEIQYTTKPELTLKIKDPLAYRIYVYVLDGTGYSSSANVPVLVK